jgi:type II secretory pathway pseudopilin PulG
VHHAASPRSPHDAGFSLLETLIAAVIVATGVAALAQLATLCVQSNARARQTTVATVIAHQKVEELFADAAAAGLPASPAGTLDRNVDGYCEFVDTTGRALGRGPAPPAGSAYVRRWSIDPVPGSPSQTSIVQVLVLDLRRGLAAGSIVPGLRLAGSARLVAAVRGQAF